MGIKQLITNTLLRVDVLSTPPTFRTRKEPAYETIAGGVLSLGIMTFFCYFLYISLSQMLQNLDITYTQAQQDNVQSTSAISTFPFAFGIEGVNLSALPRKFIVSLTQNRIIRDEGGALRAEEAQLQLSRCNVSDWREYGQNFQKQFDAFGFNEMLCMTKGQPISLRGYEGSDTYEYLTIEIKQCNATEDVLCDSTASIQSFMSGYLSKKDYFKVRFFTVDTIITPTNDDPLSHVLEKNIFMGFSNTMGTVGYISMSEFQIASDTSLFPIESYSNTYGTFIQKFVSNSITIESTRYITYNIYRSTRFLTISRTIGKLDTVLSYVGGLFSLLFTAVSFFLGSYSQYKYQLYVGESILSDSDGKRVKADDLTVGNYFFYCCYDWLDAFGIAPTFMTSLRQIHETREQSCQQLDPALILRRIKYLEDANKILVSQHRELCLYLAGPMTLQQAKRMRNTLLFYDQLVNQYQESQASRQTNLSDQKLHCFRSNAIRNEKEMVMHREIERETEQQLSKQQQEQILGSIICDALKKLDEDTSPEAQKLRGLVSEGQRKWIKQSQCWRNNEGTTLENKSDISSLVVKKASLKIYDYQLDKQGSQFSEKFQKIRS